MTKASDNAYPSILVNETTAPAAPAALKRRLYVDANKVLRWIDSSSLDSPLVALNKWNATAAPAVTDDSGDGYAIGSRWIDTTNDKEYVCLDSTVGAAVWTETTAGGASGPITASGLTMATARLLGRTTASTGAIEEITVGSGLSLSAGALTAAGGKSYVTKPGIRPPDSAGTGDIEFLSYANGTDPTAGPGLSWGNQGSATGTVNSGALVMNSATTIGLRALLKATPGAGNFQMDTAVSAFQFENTHVASIVMLWGTPGAPTAIRGAGFYWNSGVATRTQYVWTTYNTSWAGTADVVTALSAIPAPTFLRVEWDGTNLLFKVSHSGISGTFSQITSQALGLGRPDYIGVGVNNNGASTASIAAFHYLRFGWTADFDPTTDA